VATKAEIIEMLKDDMRDEHGALILYLRHAYFIGESGEACTIEETARDEMRHYKWLAQGVVQLGGVPTIERTPMDIGGEGPVQWMARDIRAEEDAIAKYGRHLAAIDDPRVTAMIERILTDEHAHHERFVGFRDGFAAAPGPLPAIPADGVAVPAKISDVLDYGTGHEYSVTLQYLLHSFMTSDYEASRELETVAVNEMQHMGWLSEYSAEIGHAPLLEPHEVDRSPRTEGMLGADIEAEKAVFATYGAQIEELSGQPQYAELVDILTRNKDNEGWHIRMLGLMLDRVKATRPPHQRPGVGRTQPQVEGQPLEAAGAPAGPASPPSEPTMPVVPEGPHLTVGSLSD
jgi:bacterioferritin